MEWQKDDLEKNAAGGGEELHLVAILILFYI